MGMLKATSPLRASSPSTTLPWVAALLTLTGDPPPSPVSCLPTQCEASQAHVPSVCYLVSHSSAMLTPHLFQADPPAAASPSPNSIASW